ncbi:MAG: DUF1574 family protein [Leptospiraceae bacterium]|nr:DUF1574 family protein [Leptospiraceae bacterium]
MKRKILYPIFLLLALICFDKILLIPKFNECCIKGSSIQVFRIDSSSFTNLREDYNILKKDNKKVILNIGSSLSHGFYYSEDERFVKNNNLVKDKDFFQKLGFINQPIPGSTSLSYFVRLNLLLDSGIRPDYILLEVAPHTFNSNTIWYYYESREAINLELLKNHFFEVKPEDLILTIQSNLFLSSYTPIGRVSYFEDISKKYFKLFIDADKVVIKNFPFQIYQTSKQTIFEALERGKSNFDISDKFKNYQIDEGLKFYLKSSITRLKKENIKFVLWYPKVQENVYVTHQRSYGSEWDKYVDQELSKENYINMNEEKDSHCDYFIDPMHSGIQCFGELITILKNKNLIQ